MKRAAVLALLVSHGVCLLSCGGNTSMTGEMTDYRADMEPSPSLFKSRELLGAHSNRKRPFGGDLSTIVLESSPTLHDLPAVVMTDRMNSADVTADPANPFEYFQDATENIYRFTDAFVLSDHVDYSLKQDDVNYLFTEDDSLVVKRSGASLSQSAPEIVPPTFTFTDAEPISTLSASVDTASFTLTRQSLDRGILPPPTSVRIEELINYFDYEYPMPEAGQPLSLYSEAADCPWNPDHDLVLLSLQAKDVDLWQRPPANLVFLVDTSGSMATSNRLPLVKESLLAMADFLLPQDRVSIVQFSSHAESVLDGASASNFAKIAGAIQSMTANGSTNGSGGLDLAYDAAKRHFIENGINRVVLCTDGDFNTGLMGSANLGAFAEEKAKSGVYLSLLGFGINGNADHTMSEISRRGNGNYAYVDDFDTAWRCLANEATGTLLTVAKDTKIQVTFNPSLVAGYRLIGYDARHLEAGDFSNPRRDAGEVGAGQSVTYLYEVIPSSNISTPSIAGGSGQLYTTTRSGSLLGFHVRYKDPQTGSERELKMDVEPSEVREDEGSPSFRLAASAAALGMLLRYGADSEWKDAAGVNEFVENHDSGRGGDGNELAPMMATACDLLPGR